jgi:hypothetical protein
MARLNLKQFEKHLQVRPLIRSDCTAYRALQ